MTELVSHKIDPEAFNQLPANYQYFVNLRAETPISGLDPLTVKKFCLDLITISMVEVSPNGQSDRLILESQTNALINELARFGYLTPSEVKECFRIGIRGESGPYFGMCAKTYHQFIKHWVEKKERGLAWEAYLDKLKTWRRAEKPTLGKEFFGQACEKAYQHYLKKGELPTSPFKYYDFLKDYTGLETLIDLIDYPEILKEAELVYRDKLKQAHKILGEITKGWVKNPREFKKDGSPNENFNKVWADCIKEASVKYYFEGLKSIGKDRVL